MSTNWPPSVVVIYFRFTAINKSHISISCIDGYEIIIKDMWLTYPKRSRQEISLTYSWFYNFKVIGRMKYSITTSQPLILTNPHLLRALVGLAVENDTNNFQIAQFFLSIKVINISIKINICTWPSCCTLGRPRGRTWTCSRASRVAIFICSWSCLAPCFSSLRIISCTAVVGVCNGIDGFGEWKLALIALFGGAGRYYWKLKEVLKSI